MKKLLNILSPNKPLWENKEKAKTDGIAMRHIQNQNAIVQEIHDTFYSEVDRLLAEAGIKLSSDTNKTDVLAKADRLSMLGFNNAKEVSVATKERIRLSGIERVNTEKGNLIEAINYFSFKYPQYKFITEASVKKICQKYGLIYGQVSLYKGEVPDKNLAEIEKLSIKEEDFVFEQEPNWRMSLFGRQINKNLIGYEERAKHLIFHEGLLTDRALGNYGFEAMQECVRLVGNKAPLEIAAPIKDFDTRNMEVKDFKLSPIEVPDPVVLHPVMFKGIKHYLIVTAWGLEGTDELVVNQRNN